MGTRLEYPALPDGYRWNLLYKIYNQTGKWAGTATTSSKTYIQFAEEVTQDDIDKVDAIMTDPNTACDPVLFQQTGNTYVLKDIWEYRASFEADCGFNVAISYRQSPSPPSNEQDEIVLQPTDPTYQALKILTNPEKNVLVNAVAALGRWE